VNIVVGCELLIVRNYLIKIPFYTSRGMGSNEKAFLQVMEKNEVTSNNNLDVNYNFSF
jgi:hypothetical protein